jgi:hypothetical protein
MVRNGVTHNSATINYSSIVMFCELVNFHIYAFGLSEKEDINMTDAGSHTQTFHTNDLACL